VDLIVAFLTGLTTGGLSCLAVQGGLLASSLAYQIEQDLQAQGGTATGKFKPRIAQPILLFLIAKLAAYTLLGFLLGALGSLLQLTPLMRAILLGAIGIFMIGNGLRMLKVHPIFRYFVIEPPARLTRYIRRRSKKEATSLATPLFLGAMTVFIPCGVTQAMMAAAMGTGNPWQGMTIMFAFILGTSPVFFALSYLATRLGATIEKYFTRIVAVVVIFLGLVSIDSGLTLAGSPISFSRLISPVTQSAQAVVDASAPVSQSAMIVINAQDNGYTPKVQHALANTALKLDIVTSNTTSCARSIVFPDLNVEKILPVSGHVTVDVPPQQKDFVMRYSCSMGMYTGQIVFDQ
jgi:sulfite exporter TauE/SafE